jgi:hypothetical protein
MAQIIKTDRLNICDIVVSKVTKNKNGSQFAYIGTKTNKKIMLQGPQMFAPFGLSEFISEQGVKYSIDLSFIDKDSDVKIAKFYTLCKDIDEFMIKQAVVNAKEWFGKNLTEDVVKEFYRPLIKEGKKKGDNDKYPDTVNFKLRTNKDGDLNVKKYDMNRNEISIDEPIITRSKIRCIFEISPIWFINRKNFGVSFNCIQMQIEKPDKISGYCFDDSDNESDNEFENI